MCAGAGGEARDAAAAIRVGGGNGRTTERKMAGRGVDRDVEAVDRRPFVFGRKKVGVGRRPSAMVDAGGVGGAGAFGALASTEEEVSEKEVDITLLPPKPKKKEKAKETKQKAVVKAATDAAEEAAEGESGAAGAGAESVVVRGAKLRVLEVLSLWSDHIEKTSKEAVDKKQTTARSMQCTLVAAMLAAEAAKAAEAEREKAAAVAAEEATATATTEDKRRQKGQMIRTKGLLGMKAAKKDNGKVVETVEEKSQRLRKSLAESLW